MMAAQQSRLAIKETMCSGNGGAAAHAATIPPAAEGVIGGGLRQVRSDPSARLLLCRPASPAQMAGAPRPEYVDEERGPLAGRVARKERARPMGKWPAEMQPSPVAASSS